MVTKHYVKNGINNEVETNIININGNCISSSNVNTIDGVSITDDNKLFDELEKLL
ncbi:MAG: hypothetical protein GY793_01610 [Proteobacteria bacterium]|nr:hypothetical protein [Pseudomonadota bacterium]